MKKILGVIFLAILVGCSNPKMEVDLSSLDIEYFACGWGKAQVNKSISGKSLSIGGQVFEKGIGTHAYSEAQIKLDGKEGKFTSYVGVDDNNNSDTVASVIFYVFTNKGIVFNSGVMRKGDAAKFVEVDLKGITDLYLVVEATPDGIEYDHANWADAKFIVNSLPQVVKNEDMEDYYILTPAPSPSPRINGAKIVGASPNKPFLFTIATTGMRPIDFSVEGLPEGLVLDAEKGIISGKTAKTGNYTVSVTAENSAGVCKDEIDIIIGGDLALTPHMGWNSWYIYGLGVTQENMEKSAKAMHDEGLIHFGYTYVNIDDGWEIKVDSDDPVRGGHVRNPGGTIRTNKDFPDMKRMTDYIHSLGLKAGLYSSPGYMTCGGYAGSLGYEAKDIKTFADWGFDFLKYDWCSYTREVKSSPITLADYKKPYELIGRLCKNASRDIILNMCQYGMGEVWKWGKESGGHSWRTTGDINGGGTDLIASMFNIGFFQERLRDYAGPGGWNDPDYLLFGDIYDWDNGTKKRSPFSASEHYTCMTLWSILSAPLIFSGDITSLDEFTKNVLCNAEVIDVNQDKLGKQGYCIYNKDLIEIWKKDLIDGEAVAIFNRRPVKNKVDIDWKDIGFKEDAGLRDLWRQEDLGKIKDNPDFEIPRHGCMLLKIK